MSQSYSKVSYWGRETRKQWGRREIRGEILWEGGMVSRHEAYGDPKIDFGAASRQSPGAQWCGCRATARQESTINTTRARDTINP